MQHIFKNATVEELDDRLRTGETLEKYFKSSFNFKDEDIIKSSSIMTSTPKPVLVTSGGKVSEQDLKNAIKIHSYLSELNEVQASDKRIWAYMTHVEFMDYCQERWGYAADWVEVMNDNDERLRAVRHFRQHWFIGTSARGLERNAVARLWWGAHQTYAPWRSLPGSGIPEHDDPYTYTKEIFRSQDTFVQIMGRSFFWDKIYLIAVLEFIRRNGAISTGELRDLVRMVVRNLNLLLGSRGLSFMRFEDIVQIIEQTAKESGWKG